MAAPSMVHRSGDTLIVRSVVSGDQLFLDDCAEPSAEDTFNDNYLDEEVEDFNDDDKDLPQCKIKRNYTCNHCKYFTQNPRHFLTHLRDVHKEKVRIYECPNCLYASKHFQKLLRHMKMVHGSCDGVELPDFSRRRITRERKRKHDEDRSSATEDKDTKPVEPVAMPNDEDDMSKNRISPTELKCSLCTFTTRFQGQLTRHERQEHIKTKFFRCGKCNYVTHIKARYTKHVKYHSMPMIKCDLCDFRTPYKWNLDRHMKNHGGQGAFKCSACNFTADIKQSLTVHEMNHHVPPVGQAAGLGVGRRRNKVGASDIIAAEEAEEIDQRELELLRMEQDDAETAQSSNTYYSMETTSAPQNNNNRSPKLSKRLTSGKKHAYIKEFVNPEDMVQHANGKVSLKIKCKICNFKTYSENEMSKHEKSKHNSDLITNETSPPAKKVRRPIPNLIPIQSPVTPSVGTLLKIPTLRIKSDLKAQESDQMSQKDINDICAKSANSSLKDFASLFGVEDALVSDRENGKASNSTDVVDSSFRKKNASFFDKLKEKLMTNAGESCNLICKHCGHASSCLSESAAHQKNCGKDDEKNNSLPPMVNSLAITSTRCQHCRHRCKSSADLLNHLQTCSEANNSDTQGTSSETNEKIVVPHDIDDEASVDDPQVPHPMENVVFVWNTLPPIADESVKSRIGDDDSLDLSIRTSSPMSESSSVIGCDITPTFTKKRSPIGDNNDNGKKVFKCPHCSFWASTASRFHVHIVGHLNKKPFECSLCSYRSNWRWDITKHIRLKAVRDPVHEKARVLMTDETGRRNYSKYNKYITLMKVTEPSADSSGSGRRTKAVENMSQGNVPTNKEVHSFSSLPKLTQALIGYRGLEKPNSQSTPLRPPPALKTAEETKKTLFKCKKCNFRDADRNVVLTHVKGHYRDAENQQLQTLHLSGASLTIRPSGIMADSTATDMSVVKSEQGENDEASVALAAVRVAGVAGATAPASAPFRCGHCHQVSNWKHVIQRHCRLKHSGDIRVELGDKCIEDRVINLDNMLPEDTPELPAGTDGKCDKCPYTSASIAALIAHYKQHSPSNDSVFKCYFCPYYVTSKPDLLQHLPLHGISDPEKYFNSRTSAGNSKPEISQLKRYQCRRCPYVSNSKSQFMYHKQFHHPLVEGAVFKCGMCSYNVTRRHLLHQHLRVHGVVIPPVKIMKNISKNGETDVESVDEIEEITIGEFDADIPLVWVSKDNEFKKMFKCRHCSHVDVLRDNISEHEKQHNSIISFVEEKISDQGVIQCLVDDSKSDLEQVADISRALLEASDRKNNMNAGDIATLNENIQNFDMEILHFCTFCPARFLHEKEIIIHTKFHNISSPYRCRCCSYTAKQETQLLAHNTVHMEDYQRKTRQLQEMHITSVNHKQPRTTAIIDGMGLESPVWIAIAETQKRETGSQICDENDLENVISASKVPNKHYPCDKCPARFYKEALLEYHSSLHGSDSKYKCRFCNYAVKTSVNLIKHEAQHTNGNRDITNDAVQGPDAEPMYQSSDANQISTWPNQQSPRVLEVDPQFGTLMHGNPKFIYPTYMKNGRLKEKRYKCHKCPSAFEKRDQYKVHLSLHGAKQRYKCEACDYSVKYYANYVQHIRKHQTNGDVVQAENKFKPERKLSFDDDTKSGSDQMRNDGPFSKLAVKTMTYPRKPGLSVIDKQTMMIMKERRTSSISVASSKDDDKKLLVRCDRCPFTDSRRDVVDSHSSRHIAVSGVTCTYTCDHCDFSVPQSNTLKDHTNVHYARNKSKAPEAFAKYEQLELTFSAEDREYETLFKDIGVKYKTIRFKPDFNDKTDQWDTGLEKLYLSTKNGELVTDKLAQNIF